MPRNSIRMLLVLGVPLPTRMTMVVRLSFGGGDFGDPNTPYIAGPKGNVYKNFVCDIPDWERKLADFPEPEPQVTDFIECVKTRQPFALNEKNGFRSATIVNMGAVALRLNRTLNFDPVKLEFIDDEAANRLLDQPMRAPWNI